jgi:hypothetical protein
MAPSPKELADEAGLAESTVERWALTGSASSESNTRIDSALNNFLLMIVYPP